MQPSAMMKRMETELTAMTKEMEMVFAEVPFHRNDRYAETPIQITHPKIMSGRCKALQSLPISVGLILFLNGT
jgi:hypothetical protein